MIKKILLIYLLIISNVIAGLPPTSSKGNGESVFSPTFKTDYGTIPVTRSGTGISLGTIPLSAGGTGSTTKNFVDLATAQTIAGTKQFSDSVGAGITPNAALSLDVGGTTKASRPNPPMTTAQMNALTVPVGSTVFNSDVGAPAFFNGTTWQYGPQVISNDTTFTAKIAAAGTISQLNKTGWLSGNCVYGTPVANRYNCPVASGLITSQMNCNGTSATTSTRTILYDPASTTSNLLFQEVTITTTPASVSDTDFYISCGKTGNDYANSGVNAYLAKNANVDTTPYTPIFSGIGTVTNIDFKYSLSGDKMFINGCAKAGGTIPSAVIASFSLPSPYSLNAASLATSGGAGIVGYFNLSSGAGGNGIWTTGQSGVVHAQTSTSMSNLYFARLQNTNVSNAVITGSDTGTNLIAPSGNFCVSNVIIPIDGRSNSGFMVGLLYKRIATLSDVKSNLSSGGASISGLQTRVLNTLADPTGIVTSLVANAFTLQAGTYYIEASAPAYNPGRHNIKLRNTTDSVNVIQGAAEYTVAVDSQTRSTLSGEFTITSAKSFVIQHGITSANATEGLGVSGNTNADSSVFTIVKIEKLK